MTLSSSKTLSAGVHYRVLDNGCWQWLGKKDKHGYGFSGPGLSTIHNRAYRASYILAKGEVPAGMHTDHLCRYPSCVNPDHLEPVTPAENCRRGVVPKINFEQAKEIRRRVAAGEPYAPIAEEFGVSQYVMWQVAEDISWREDPDAPRTPVRPERHCRNCGELITEGNRHKVYCKPQCRHRFNGRAAYHRKKEARRA